MQPMRQTGSKISGGERRFGVFKNKIGKIYQKNLPIPEFFLNLCRHAIS